MSQKFMKRFKDPIYGYIDVDDDIADKIIDTPEFQRLRNIIQTSYSPLYASAVHNRFVHSLGVYYLGQIVAKSINKISKVTIDSERYKKIFEFACLLHDVGHAPFSHTGEYLYLGEKSSRDELHKAIINLTCDSTLSEEIEKKNYAAAPHELMSVVVALKKYDFLFENMDERSFFARCILGYEYSSKMDLNKSYLNCIISMLNSSLIDVDKLDYLMRDSYITGFDTVSIDYERLLKNVKIIEKENECRLIYSKAAVSIIENVIYAHDAERKWIQNHPVVQYEAFILKYAMEKLNIEYEIFSYEALTNEGKVLTDSLRVSLLSDGDVLFLMKNRKNDKLINEYFARNERRHPLWKSEAEYKAIFNRGFSEISLEKLENEFEELSKYLNYNNNSSKINDEALQKLKEDIEKTKSQLENVTKTEKNERLKKQIEQKQKHVKWLKCLKAFAESQNIDFDFIIIKASQFNSGFGKVALDDLEIEFPELQYPSKFKEVTNTLSSFISDRDKFFYIFYRRNNQKHIEVKKLAQELAKLCLEDCY